MVLVGKLMAEVGYPLNTNGSDALAGNFVKYAILISSPLGANPFEFEADLWTSVLWSAYGSTKAGSSSPVGALAAWTPCRPSSMISASATRARMAIEMAALRS